MSKRMYYLLTLALCLPAIAQEVAAEAELAAAEANRWPSLVASASVTQFSTGVGPA